MAIQTRTLKAGQVLTVNYKGKTHECKVVKGKDGLEFVTSGKTFKSISGAGKFYHGSRSIGGFGFWTLVGENDKKARGKTAAASKVNATIATDAELKSEWDNLTPAERKDIKALEATSKKTAKTPVKKATKKSPVTK